VQPPPTLCLQNFFIFIILNCYLMQIEFKQWWPSITAITSCIKLLNIKTHDIWPFEWKRICAGFYRLFVYVSSYQNGEFGYTGLSSPHFCVCPKPWPGLPTSCHMSCVFMFNNFMQEVIITGYIYKQTIKTCTYSLPLKRPTYSHEMINNLN
jgi:hypothetical protein